MADDSPTEKPKKKSSGLQAIVATVAGLAIFGGIYAWVSADTKTRNAERRKCERECSLHVIDHGLLGILSDEEVAGIQNACDTWCRRPDVSAFDEDQWHEQLERIAREAGFELSDLEP